MINDDKKKLDSTTKTLLNLNVVQYLKDKHALDVTIPLLEAISEKKFLPAAELAKKHKNTINFFEIFNPEYLNEQDSEGNLKIHKAAAAGCSGTLLKELSKGVINNQNHSGMTPLHLAVLNKHNITAETLLKSGANLAIQDKSGNNPFDLAIENKNKEMALLLRNNIEDVTKEYGKSETYESGLIKNPDGTKNHQDNILRAARMFSLKHVAEILIEHKNDIDISKRDTYGNCVLHYVAMAPKSSYLLKQVSTEIIDEGTTFEIYHSETTKEKSKIITESKEDNTALHLAAMYGQKDNILTLFQLGAKIKTNYQHLTPLDLSLIHGHQEIAKFLFKSYPSIQVAELIVHYIIKEAVSKYQPLYPESAKNIFKDQKERNDGIIACLDLLLNIEQLKLDKLDDKKNTWLHSAILAADAFTINLQNVLETLIKLFDTSECLAMKNSDGDTPKELAEKLFLPKIATVELEETNKKKKEINMSKMKIKITQEPKKVEKKEEVQKERAKQSQLFYIEEKEKINKFFSRMEQTTQYRMYQRN